MDSSALQQRPALVPPSAVMAYLAGRPAKTDDFSFMVGRWNAPGKNYNPDGSLAAEYEGEWTARYLSGDRILLDEYRPNAGGNDLSHLVTLRTFCPERKRWEMTLLVAHQPPMLRTFSGNREGDEMHLLGHGELPDGTAIHARVVFSDITDSRFEWVNWHSLDAGKTWWKESSVTATRID